MHARSLTQQVQSCCKKYLRYTSWRHLLVTRATSQPTLPWLGECIVQTSSCHKTAHSRNFLTLGHFSKCNQYMPYIPGTTLSVNLESTGSQY